MAFSGVALFLIWANAVELAAQGASNPGLQASEISAGRLFKIMANRTKLLLIDVRSEEEYAVSRIKGAVRVKAETQEDREGFLASVGLNQAGSTIVFYCTTAARSSDFAQSVLHDLLERGARAVHVLRGGVVTWHNERRPLVNSGGSTEYVHPFNQNLRQHLRRPELARM